VARLPARPFGSIYRPVVDVALQLPNGRRLLVPAIVDSGADDTTIPAAFLEASRIKWSSLASAPIPQTQGVGGVVEQRVCPASARWDGKLFCKQVLVVRELAMAVVGRSDFFTTFDVDFEAWDENPPHFDIERRS
jgi:predicted aspartyl protease